MILSLGFSYLNVHFLWRKLYWKTVVRYVTLNLFDVNDDVIFLFTFYKHRRKQISAVILKPNIEVTSSTRYLYGNFPSYSYDSLEKIFRFFVRKKVFVNSVTHVRICVRKIYAQKLAYELSWIARLVRRANMRHHAKCCADRSNRFRDQCWDQLEEILINCNCN